MQDIDRGVIGSPDASNQLGKTNRFKKMRPKLAQDLYNQYNSSVFENRLPADIEISWNKRMLKKAGQAILSESNYVRSAKIELSEKVNSKIFIEI